MVAVVCQEPEHDPPTTAQARTPPLRHLARTAVPLRHQHSRCEQQRCRATHAPAFMLAASRNQHSRCEERHGRAGITTTSRSPASTTHAVGIQCVLSPISFVARTANDHSMSHRLVFRLRRDTLLIAAKGIELGVRVSPVPPSSPPPTEDCHASIYPCRDPASSSWLGSPLGNPLYLMPTSRPCRASSSRPHHVSLLRLPWPRRRAPLSPPARSRMI